MSGICAFFGHRDTIITPELENRLKAAVETLIAQGFDEFWCCGQGTFDWAADTVMQQLKRQYRHIVLCLVTPYNPDTYSDARQKYLTERYDEIIYPFAAADGLPRFAISRRNRYIAAHADVVICYVEDESGGAYKAMRQAQKLHKQIINLA